MDTILTVFNEVLILVIIMAIGVFIHRKKMISDNTIKELSKILINITVPMLILSSYTKNITLDIIKDSAIVFLLSLIIHVTAIIISNIMLRKTQNAKLQVFKLASVFTNCAFIGIPVSYSLFGDKGTIYASLFMIVYNILIWTYGISIVKKEKNFSLRKGLLNPAFFAIIIGFILVIFDIDLPYVLNQTFDIVGHVTTPVSMLIIGVLISETNIKKVIKDKYLYIIALVRLVIIPTILIFIFYIIGLKGIHIQSVIVLSAMPVGTMVAIIANNNDYNPLFVSEVVGISTILSVITIPLMATIASYLL